MDFMKNILKHELIGSRIRVIDAKNKANKDIEGTIIDETRNTLSVDCKGSIKKLIKKNITITINDMKINGEKLIGRSEERIKN